MKGTNEITKPFWLKNEGTLLVNDVFYTIQGEGPDAGTPAFFVRLSKCNLRCFFCDTEFEGGKVFKTEDMVNRIAAGARRVGCELVVITGGEPLLQNIVPFVTALNAEGLRVAVETAGTVFYPKLRDVFGPGQKNKIVCSPKTPRLASDLAPLISALKYIVQAGRVSPTDGLPLGRTQITSALEMPPVIDLGKPSIWRPDLAGMWSYRHMIYLQAMDEGDAEKNQANLEEAARMCMAFGYRLTVQMHKLANLP